MAAGGFREFIPGEVLLDNLINDFLMQGILVFADAAARDVAITAPVEGQFVFLKDTDVTQFFDGTDFVELDVSPESITGEFLVVGGGGGGAGGASSQGGGGGGAGLYLTGTAIPTGVSRITVGGGATGGGSNSNGATGGDSVFGESFGTFPLILAYGGGFGGRPRTDGESKGSGGGAGGSSDSTERRFGGSGVFTGGNRGGSNHLAATAVRSGGGGGGAGASGTDATTNNSENPGGAGVANSITGSSITYAVGGRGADQASPSTGATGTASRGNGGEGGVSAGGNGGSGVIVFAVPTGISVTFSGGVDETSSVVSGNDVYVVTAAGPTDEVTIG